MSKVSGVSSEICNRQKNTATISSRRFFVRKESLSYNHLTGRAVAHLDDVDTVDRTVELAAIEVVVFDGNSVGRYDCIFDAGGRGKLISTGVEAVCRTCFAIKVFGDVFAEPCEEVGALATYRLGALFNLGACCLVGGESLGRFVCALGEAVVLEFHVGFVAAVDVGGVVAGRCRVVGVRIGILGLQDGVDSLAGVAVAGCADKAELSISLIGEGRSTVDGRIGDEKVVVAVDAEATALVVTLVAVAVEDDVVEICLTFER